MKLEEGDESSSEVNWSIHSSELLRLGTTRYDLATMSSEFRPEDKKKPKSDKSKEATSAAKQSDNDKPKPKRPLSAYNLFFKQEREKMLKDMPIRKEGKPRRSHGKIGFADLARSIASKWKNTTKEDRAVFDRMAMVDKDRYQREMQEWKKGQPATASAVAKASKKKEVPKLQQQQGSFTSLFEEPIQGSFMREPTSFLRDTFDRTFDDEPMDNEDHNDIAPEPYAHAQVFGSEFSTSSQQTSHQPHYHPPPLQQNQQADTATAQSDPLLNVSDLASQLGEESTELYLNMFRPSRKRG